VTGGSSRRRAGQQLAARMPRVVVVEDHEDLRAAVAEMLAHEGWDVRTFGEVEPALDAIGASPPDVVLTDINVGARTGQALARALAAESATAGIPVVAMSGSVVPTPGILRAFTLFLSKPVDLTMLDDTLREVVAFARFRRFQTT
jgi:CheY-like chemotaxis protein